MKAKCDVLIHTRQPLICNHTDHHLNHSRTEAMKYSYIMRRTLYGSLTTANKVP